MKVITANELLSGSVVYLHDDPGFGPNLQRARLFAADDQTQLDDMLARALENTRLVGVEVIDVERDDTGHVHARRLREQIRASGPSVDGSEGVNAEGVDHVPL